MTQLQLSENQDPEFVKWMRDYDEENDLSLALVVFDGIVVYAAVKSETGRAVNVWEMDGVSVPSINVEMLQ